MTTVIIDCSTMEVASDSQTTGHRVDSGGGCLSHTTSYTHDTVKLREKCGTIFVGAGDSDAISNEWQEYLLYGCLNSKPRGEYRIALIQRKGDHLQVDLHESKKVKIWFGLAWTWGVESSTHISNTKLITFGSGGNYAYAARLCGKSVKEAIEVASVCDKYTDNNVQYFNFKGETGDSN